MVYRSSQNPRNTLNPFESPNPTPKPTTAANNKQWPIITVFILIIPIRRASSSKSSKSQVRFLSVFVQFCRLTFLNQSIVDLCRPLRIHNITLSNGSCGSADYFDKVMTKFIVTNRADACKTAINLFSYDSKLFVLGAHVSVRLLTIWLI